MDLRKLRESYVYTSPARHVAWTETLLLTLAGPLLGYWLHPGDMFFAASGFAWLLFGPLLAGLRYGFTYGVNSALVLVIALVLVWKRQWLPTPDSPAQWSIGLLLVGVLAGEFRDLWTRRVEQLSASSEYCQQRMDEFTRAFNVLKMSHDSLEKRVAANTTNLRDCILSIRRQMLQAQGGSGVLLGLAPLIVRQFANYGSLQIASLHQVHDNRTIEERPAATFGSGAYIEPDDPLLAEALATGKAVSLRPEHAESEQLLIGRLLLAVPVVDVYGRIWAMMAVQQMPFRAFHKENIRLLAVIGGHIGDLLAKRTSGVAANRTEEQDFLFELDRCLDDARSHRLDSMVLGIGLGDPRYATDLSSLIVGQHRGLDRSLSLENGSGDPVILLLMPLTNSTGAWGYQQRLANMIKEQYGQDRFEAVGIEVHTRELGPQDSPEQVLGDLYAGCNLEPPILGQALSGKHA